MIRKLLLPSLILLILFSAVFLQRPRGFTACHSITSRIHHPEWEIAPLSPEQNLQLKRIFAQQFHYLASGSQAYAFESEDQKHIIKFFRMNQLMPRWIHGFWPQKMEKRLHNFYLLFNGYKLAYEKLRQESGLVYIHLNASKDLVATLHAKDRDGVEQEICLDEVIFVVQEKAELLHDRIHRLKAENKKDELKTTRLAVLNLIQKQLTDGIADLDDGIDRNYGFVGERAIHIDVGRIFLGKQLGEYERAAAWIHQAL